MKVLVTGGAGFIGSHTVDALLAKGYDVRILDNFSKPVHLRGRPSYLPADAEIVEGDVRNKQDMEKAMEGIEAVCHFAAYQDYLPDFSKFFHVNSVGTAMIYEVAVEKKIDLKKVLVASSQAVYGEGKYHCVNKDCSSQQSCSGILYPNIRPQQRLKAAQWEHICPRCGQVLQHQLTDESRINPQNQYAVSKYTQELISLSLGKRYNIPTVATRYSIVQGPRQSFYNAYSGACRIFCLSCFFNKPIVIYEDGRQVRDFVNIEDVVTANLMLLDDKRADFEVFNVGAGKSYTVEHFAETVKKVFDKNITSEINSQYRFGDTRHIFSDISKLKSLGWQPKHSPEKSVTDYKDWLTQQDNIDDVLDYAAEKMKKLNVVQNASA